MSFFAVFFVWKIWFSKEKSVIIVVGSSKKAHHHTWDHTCFYLRFTIAFTWANLLLLENNSLPYLGPDQFTWPSLEKPLYSVAHEITLCTWDSALYPLCLSHAPCLLEDMSWLAVPLEELYLRSCTCVSLCDTWKVSIVQWRIGTKRPSLLG